VEYSQDAWQSNLLRDTKRLPGASPLSAASQAAVLHLLLPSDLPSSPYRLEGHYSPPPTPHSVLEANQELEPEVVGIQMAAMHPSLGSAVGEASPEVELEPPTLVAAQRPLSPRRRSLK